MVVPGDFLLTCPHCSASPTAFAEIAQVQVRNKQGHDMRLRLLTCPVCGGGAVMESSGNQDSVRQVYPAATGSEWTVEHLTDDVGRDWEEATNVYRVGAYEAAVVMCGRTLEAAADALGIEGRSLQQRINKMLKDGLITVGFRDAMDYVRLIRNTGAHAGSPVSNNSAEGTMRFTQQALRLLFEVPGELARLVDHPPELDEPSEEESA